MAAKKRSFRMPSRASANITLQFGLVSIPVALKPFVPSDRSQGVSGRMLCAEHLEPVTQLWQCGAGDHTITRQETVIGYEHGDRYVILAEGVVDEIVQERETSAAVKRLCKTDEIDSIFIEKSFLLWPQAGSEQPYKLFATVLANKNLAAIVTATLTKQTRSYAVRWSERTGSLVCQLLFFDSEMRWDDTELVRDGLASLDAPAAPMVDAATSLVVALEGEFVSDEVVDTYHESMIEAIQAAAKGKPGKRATKTAAKDTVGDDLLAALKASVQATTTKPDTPARAQSKAKTKA